MQFKTIKSTGTDKTRLAVEGHEGLGSVGIDAQRVDEFFQNLTAHDCYIQNASMEAAFKLGVEQGEIDEDRRWRNSTAITARKSGEKR